MNCLQEYRIKYTYWLVIKPLEAYSSNRKDNIPVEARDHVIMFHQYFFTLDPDEKVIDANLSKGFISIRWICKKAV